MDLTFLLQIFGMPTCRHQAPRRITLSVDSSLDLKTLERLHLSIVRSMAGKALAETSETT